MVKNNNDLYSLRKLAYNLKMEDLQEICTSHMLAGLNINNVCEIYSILFDVNSCERNKCAQFIFNNLAAICKEKFLFNLTHDTVYDLFCQYNIFIVWDDELSIILKHYNKCQFTRAAFNQLMQWFSTGTINKLKTIKVSKLLLTFSILLYEIELENICAKQLAKTINDENVCATYASCYRFDNSLPRKCLAFIEENVQTVIDNNTIECLPKRALYKVLNSKRLCISNVQLFKEILKIVPKNKTNIKWSKQKRIYLKPFLRGIEFKSMSLPEYMECIKEDIYLFEPQEWISVIIFIIWRYLGDKLNKYVSLDFTFILLLSILFTVLFKSAIF